MKILTMIPERRNGVYFHRQIYPHSTMADLFSDVEIIFTDSTIQFSDKALKTFDIIHISYSFADDFTMDRAKRLGIKIIIDVDDYWVLGDQHELQETYKKLDRTKVIKEVIHKADAITTTTETLAKKIRAINSNVCVLPNSLHTTDEYYKPVKHDELVLGWVGGNTHTPDLSMIQHIQNGLGYITLIPNIYEQIFSKRFSYYPNLGIPSYLDLYNELDIVLAPLVKNDFNKFKSPLKLVEAGFYKKPLIISDVEPFSEHLEHGVNCLVARKHSDWAKNIKKLRSPELREKLGQNLRNYVEKHFDIEKISKKRYEYYKEICLINRQL